MAAQLRFFLIFLGLLFTVRMVLAQGQIEIANADITSANPRLGKGVLLLKGNVKIKQRKADMYCDSAYFYQTTNSLDAFGNVRLIRKSRDGEFKVTCSTLFYSGNTGLAKARDNVVVTQEEMRLFTDFFDYNFKAETGHYYNGGRTVTPDSEATSQEGFFYLEQNKIRYVTNVKINTGDMQIRTDTIVHFADTETSYFQGPTQIYTDSNYVYCEGGWYRNSTKEVSFKTNVLLENGGQKLTADSVYYNQTTDLGFAYSNVVVRDTAQNIIVKGDFASYTEQPNTLLVSQRAMLIQVSDGDSLFIHGDTLRSHYDQTGEHRIMKVYNHVKIYNKQYQAMADSLYYSMKDSIIEMHRNPVLWADVNQLTANLIKLYTANNQIEKIELSDSPFIVFREDSLYFNQIKGKHITGYITNNKLNKIDVKGNAESLYFPKDGEEIIGVNKSQSSAMTIYMANETVSQIRFMDKPTATLYPKNYLQPNELRLSSFKWLDKHRPRKWEDIFLWIEL